jgi:hypothetical protein
METWTVIKDVLSTAFLLGIVIVWGFHVFISWRNDMRRHRELCAFIDLFQEGNKQLLLAYANAVSKAQDQKHLFIYRDPDGVLRIRTFDHEERRQAEKELERQDNNKKEEESHDQGY